MFFLNFLTFAFIFCVSVRLTDQWIFEKIGNIFSGAVKTVLFSNSCYADFGCFYTGPPYFHPLYRPISMSPFSPKNLRTKFTLYTPKLKNQGFELEPTEESLGNSTFEASNPTKIIIHGYFTRVLAGDPLLKMKDAFLEDGDYNVILVDWSRSNAFLYSQAVANSRVVGAQIAQLIRFLQENRGIKPQSVHLLGHSLGAHVAAYAGKNTPKLGRITGLDPAGPFFCGITDKRVRLDASDADFVDVIHTNTARIGIIDGLGIPEPIGDMDFYPNGGIHQPHCGPSVFNIPITLITFKTIMREESWNFVVCDHNAVNDYFIESIKQRNCTFTARECSSYRSYEKGECSTSIKAVMGHRASKVPGQEPGKKYYLRTSKKPQYCIQKNDQQNKLDEIEPK